MGNVIGLDRRELDPLEQSFRDSFHNHGQAHARIADLTVTPQRWRSTARKVARQLGRPVETVHGSNCLYAVLKDFPRDEREEAISRAAMRAAMRAAASIGTEEPTAGG